MRTILHITKRSDWDHAKARGRYEIASLAKEGFIHLSRPHQVIDVANCNFKGQSDLVLLQVGEEFVVPEIKYEGADGDLFPHAYGPINLDAVVTVHDFHEAENTFKLPEKLRLVGDTLIRKAMPGDEAEIASCHTHAWQQSYQGIVPGSVLSTRPLSFRTRLNWWRACIADGSKTSVVVAESAKHGIVGFCAVGEARDDFMNGAGEIGAIYALNEYKGKAIGASLFQRGLAELKSKGFNKVYLWVLKDNPTVQFYKKMGGTPMGREKTIDLGGPLVEIGLEWDLN